MKVDRVLYDTDFLIALFVSDQSTHGQASRIFSKIRNSETVILKLVKYELATVLSYKFSQEVAEKIIKDLEKTQLVFIDLDEEDAAQVWQEFFTHKKKKISFVDCANLVMAKKINCMIASFDKFYPEKIKVK